MDGPQGDLVMRRNKEQGPEQVHEGHVFAVARVDHVNHQLVVTVSQDILLPPVTPPHQAGQYDRKELLHGDGAVCETPRPEILKPVAAFPGTTAQGTRGIGEEVVVRSTGVHVRQHRDTIPFLEEGAPPSQVGPEGGVETNEGLVAFYTLEELEHPAEESSARPDYLGSMLELAHQRAEVLRAALPPGVPLSQDCPEFGEFLLGKAQNHVVSVYLDAKESQPCDRALELLHR